MRFVEAHAGSHYDQYQRRSQGRINIYVSYEGETVLEHLLVGRRNRPHVEYIPFVRQFLDWLDISASDEKGPRIRWSDKAGCEMCPCSPGFVVSMNSVDYRKVQEFVGYKRDLNIWLTLDDQEYVAENRQLVQNFVNETPDASSTPASDDFLEQIAQAIEGQAALKQEFAS